MTALYSKFMPLKCVTHLFTNSTSGAMDEACIAEPVNATLRTFFALVGMLIIFLQLCHAR